MKTQSKLSKKQQEIMKHVAWCFMRAVKDDLVIMAGNSDFPQTTLDVLVKKELLAWTGEYGRYKPTDVGLLYALDNCMDTIQRSRSVTYDFDIPALLDFLRRVGRYTDNKETE